MPNLRRTFRIAVFVALFVLMRAVPSSAQQYGHIYGAVDDERGTALPGVTVTLKGVGAPQIRITDEQGEYRFLNLDPGTYSLKTALDGFSTVEQPKILVALNRNTTINFTLSSAVEELITVTSETPLLDERTISQGTVLSGIELETLPTARDPWAIVNQTPGVMTGAVNVGGSESGQMTAFLGLGTTVWDNDWLIDGIQITDMTSVGFSPTYFDFEQFESIDISTGGTDVTKNVGGVSLNMVTRRGTNEFRGSARFISAKDDGLGFLGNSSSNFDCADLHPDQDCDTFATNRVDDISEYGFEAGGPAIADRLWFWGSYGVQDIGQIAPGGQKSETIIENVSVKTNAQITNANSAVASWNNGDKRIDGRGAGRSRSPETTWDQRGPTAFWRFEDTHIFSSSLFLTGSYQRTDGGFAFRVKSGCEDFSCPLEQETLLDSDGVWKQNFKTGYGRRPEEAVKIDGSYFFNTGDVTHELKFGGRIRESKGSSNFVWPGRNIAHIAGENWGADPGPIDFFTLYRGKNDLAVNVEYNSLWIQDTIAAGNWTLNLGARWDLQDGVNPPGTTGPSALPDILPPITFDEPVKPPFDWETITPRIGLTYAVGEGRDTLLRTSFSQFPAALSTLDVAWNNPALGQGGYGAYADFLFFDIEEADNQWNGTEPYIFLGGVGFDILNPTTNMATMADDFSPELTTELIVGVEHAFLPELVVGLNYTWRSTDDVLGTRRNVRPIGDTGIGAPETSADYVFEETVAAELPDGTLSETDIFSLVSRLEFTGWDHYENDDRKREYGGLALTVQKRLANRWAMRGYVNWSETTWDVPRSFLDNTDPNPDPDGSDVDGALYLVGASGGKAFGRRWLQSSWQANLNGLVQLAPERPWGFTVAGNIYAREGHPLPYRAELQPGGGPFRSVSLMDGDTDRFRLDDLVTVDLRAEKEFSATNNVSLTFGLDLFNGLNEATVLSREVNLISPRGDHVNDVVSPRVWRMSVRVSWR